MADGLAKNRGQLEQPQPLAGYVDVTTPIKTAWAKAWHKENPTYTHIKDGIPQLSRKSQRTIFRLRTGHGSLRAHLFKHDKASSAMYTLGFAKQTVAHILKDCSVLETSRGHAWPTPSILDDKL